MGRHIAPYWELALPVVAINLAVLIAYVFLTVLQFDQVRSSLESERLEVIAGRAAAPLATAAAIGLDLTNVRRLDVVLEAARQADDSIIALHVLDPDGAIVVSTTGSNHTAVGPETLRRLRQDPPPTSFRESGEYRYLVTFEKGVGEIAGALLIEYSSAAARTSVWAMAGRLATMALVFSLVSSVFSLWAIKIALRHEARIDQAFVDADSEGLRLLWRGTDRPDDCTHNEIADAVREAELKYFAVRDART